MPLRNLVFRGRANRPHLTRSRCCPRAGAIGSRLRFEALEERTLLSVVPSDPLCGYFGQYFHEVMNNYTAWETTDGTSDSLLVAVIDTGADLSHPELRDRIWINPGESGLGEPNGNDDDTNGFIDDIHGWNFVGWPPGSNAVNDTHEESHGTHVSGIIAAEMNNEIGVAGVASGATIMPVVIKPDSIEGCAAALEYVADCNMPNVIASCAFPTGQGFLNSQEFIDAVDYLYFHDVLHVNCAGNDNSRNPVNLQFEQTLFAAATDCWDQKWTLDSEGSNYGTGIDISAPGRDILSTVRDEVTAYEVKDYEYKSGTSMAAPCVSGAAALVWATNPMLSRDQVAAILLGTADGIDHLNPGYEGLLGAGRVNSARAVAAAAESVDEEVVLPPASLGPPTLDGIRELRNPSAPGTLGVDATGLTVELGNVFQTSTWDYNGGTGEYTRTSTGPMDYDANFAMVYAGESGGVPDPEFGNGNDVTVPLELPWAEDAPYSELDGYKIGKNELDFDFDFELLPGWNGELKPGYYRFTAFAYDGVEHTNGLRDTFGVVLDGNGDGVAGDDYVRYFYVGTPTPINLQVSAEQEDRGDGDPDTFELRASAEKLGYVDVIVNEATTNSVLLAALSIVTINGSTDTDTVEVDYLIDFNGTVVIDGGGGGADTIEAHGSPGNDSFSGEVGSGATFDVASRYTTTTQYSVISDNDEGRTAVYHFTAVGGGGYDVADLHPGEETNDIFYNGDQPETINHAWMKDSPDGLLYCWSVEDFTEISAEGGEWGTDTATLHGSDGDDTFRGYHDDYASLVVGRLVLTANTFSAVVADGGGGGMDSAHLHYYYDPDLQQAYGDLEVAGDMATLSSDTPTNWSNTSIGFSTLYVHSEGDNPEVIDPPFDIFYFNPVYVFFWDEDGSGIWDEQFEGNEDYYYRWLQHNGAVPLISIFPTGNTQDAVIETDTVVIPYHLVDDWNIRDLAVASGGLAIVSNETVPVLPVVKLHAHGNFEMTASAAYTCGLHNDTGGLLEVDGDAYLAGTLGVEGLRPLADLQQSPVYGDLTRTIITAAGQNGVTGEFDEVPVSYGAQTPDPPTPDEQPLPNQGTYLGSGQWFGNASDGRWEGEVWTPQDDGVYYTTQDVQIGVFQAKGGDTDTDRDIDFADFNNLANNYTGALGYGAGGKDWTQGDFDDDADVDFADFNALANGYTGAGGDYTQGRDGGANGGEESREDAEAGSGGLRDGAGEVELIVSSYGYLQLHGEDVAINGYSVVSASGSLIPYPGSYYPFSFYLMNTEYEIDAGGINSPVYFDEHHQYQNLYWMFDIEGTQDLVFYYGTSEGTFEGDVIYYGGREGGGSGAELDVGSVPDWFDQIDPQVLDELARFVAEGESSGDTSRAAAAERLLALLTLYDT